MSFNCLHLLAPGERFQPWPNPPPVRAEEERTDCEGCGAPLQRHLASCAWCTRPHPGRRADLSALLEVTCLYDTAPRYEVGWAPPRPLPPAGRLVLESGKHLDLGAQGAVMGALTVGYGVTDSELERVRHSWEAGHTGALPRKPRRGLVARVSCSLDRQLALHAPPGAVPFPNHQRGSTLKTIRLIAAALLALASASAFATNCSNGGTNWPNCTPPSPPKPHHPTHSTSSATSQSSSSSTSSAGSVSSAAVNVAASPSSTSSATGGSVGGISQSYEEFSRSNMYVLPAPVHAAPLPPGLCPKGDSMSIGILWNMISYSVSSTRTEMECLEKVLAAIKVSAPAASTPFVQAPVISSSEPARAAPAGTAESSSAVKKPEVAKPAAKKASAPKKAANKASPVPSCEETALQACKPAKRT